MSPSAGRERLDERLVRDGLAATRSRAAALIRTGGVLVDDLPLDKPGASVAASAVIRVRERPRFVSRGGDKLAGALDDLAIDPSGRVCRDVGASTGGFTDCLLQRGASAVTAVDVGYGQLDLRMREDPRVTVRERTNARHLTRDDVPAETRLVTVDVSFISSALILRVLAEVADRADWLVMVKPPFEVGRELVGKGGVVRDDALRQQAADDVSKAASGLGWREQGRVDSRIPGPKGNREIFLWLCPDAAEEA